MSRNTAICGARRPGTGREALPCILGAPHSGRPHLNAFGDAWAGEAAAPETSREAARPEPPSRDEMEYAQLARAWEDAKDRLRAAPDSARHRASLRRIEQLMSILLRGFAA